MNPSRLFILRPVATSLLMIGIILVGIVAFRELPVSALPEVDYPTIQVMTFYPGASPEVMATSVTAPLERQLGQVAGLNQMTSTSSQGSSMITLQFTLELNIDVAEQEVQAAINAAATFLPTDLPNPPIYAKINPADAPILTLGLTSSALPLSKVEDLADTRLAPRIAQMPGVGLVSLTGGQKPAVRIQANPTQLSAMGLGLDDLRTAIAQANVNQAKGSFDGPRLAYTIGTNDQLLSGDAYRPLVVAYRNGAPVLLSQVAHVVDGVENTQLAAWMDRAPAVILNVQRQPGANIIQVADRIKELLPQLTATLPASVKVEVLTDRTVTIRASVRDVEFELLLVIALVVMVIFLFLRSVPATIIPSVAVPLSLVGTFAVMYLWGFSLNNLTLMALTISTGFVVDDAIVMIENIVRFVEQGEHPLHAALKGSQQIAFTIISLSLSLIAVLIPLLFMGAIVGRLFREFAITLSVTIVISAIVSLTLTPMMCARLLRHTPDSQRGRLYRFSERVYEQVIALYDVTLRWALRHQTFMLLVAAATLVITALLYIAIPKGFFPVQDTGVILGVTQAPQDVSFSAMAKRQQRLDDVILKDPAVQSLSSFIGIDGTNTTLNSGRIQINLKPIEERDGAQAVIRRLRNAVASVQGIRLDLQPVQDLTVQTQLGRAQYQFTLQDPSAAELSDSVKRLTDTLGAMPQLRHVSSDLQPGGLQTMLVIDRDTASRLGLTLQSIDDALYDAFGQRQVSTMFTQLNQYHVVMEVQPRFQRSPKDLGSIYLRTASGGSVPLTQVVHVKEGVVPLSVIRQGQFPAATVSFDLAPGTSLGAAVTAIRDAAKKLHLPRGLEMQFQGTAAAFEASLTSTLLLILAAIVAVYIVLGVLYESYVHPVTILSTLPSAAIGALLALMVCGLDFDIVALIGVVLLIGIVKKNAIMMVDFALQAERDEHRSPRDAIHQACLLRFRPILMTTMAALLAGVPLAMGTGTGAELRRPLGVTIIGGMIVSQLLTLYTTPVIYLWFDRLAHAFRHAPESPEPPHPASPSAPEAR